MSAAPAERDPSGAPPSDGAPAAGAAADPQLAGHVADLKTPLRPICRDWDEAAFEALVLHMARTKVAWAAADSRASAVQVSDAWRHLCTIGHRDPVPRIG